MTEREELPMSALNFTHFSGAVPKHKEYSVVAEGGILFLVPEKERFVYRYDPFKDMDDLLLDTAEAGAMVASCEPFLEYCVTHQMLPLRDAEFWLHGDFFTTHPKEGQPIVDALLAFVRRYGLPLWEGIVTTTYPARCAQRLMALHQDGNDDVAYMVHYEAVRQACQSSGAVPVCTLALTMLDFYLQWIEGVGRGAFPIRHADWLMTYGQEKTPRLNAQVYDLTACINLAYVTLTTGQGKAIRQCKHCGKFFVAEDWRSEYCSPRCRGAYNSKMTRKRVKERKLREEQ